MESKSNFNVLDALVMLIYLAGIIYLGIKASKQNTKTENFFVGRHKFPAWAVGLSMMGTMISSVSFLAYPAAAYALDWRQFLSNLTMPLAAVLAVLVFIPIFRAKMRITAYQYLEGRYGKLIRFYGAFCFLLLQVIRVGSVMYLMAIPVNILTGIAILPIITICSIFIGIYTIIGGIEAVIWADAAQAIILLGGGIISLFFIILNVPGGFGQIFNIALEHNKFAMGSFDFNFTERTFWTMLILGAFNWTAAYATDQTMIQRYIVASSLKEARKATLIYAVIGLPTWILFFFIGTCLFVLFQVNPNDMISQSQPDQVFPYFITTYIPSGLKGLIIIGIVAAAVSSLDATINASASVATVDIMRDILHRNKLRKDSYYLNAARLYTAFMIICMIFGAAAFSYMPKETMFDLILIIASVFGGCLPGIFLAGLFCPRIDNFSCLIGLTTSIPLNIYLLLNTLKVLPESFTIGLHPYWTMLVVNVAFIFTAYLCGVIRSLAGKNIKFKTINNTIWGNQKWI